MNKLKLLLCSILMSIVVFSQIPVTVYASETPETTSDSGGEAGLAGEASIASGDAIDDILQNTRFDGAIDTITWLTKFMDNVSIQVISVASYLIIIFACLKNVLAGVYCSNTVFCDAVHEAHLANEQITLRQAGDYFRGGRALDTSVSGLKKFLLGLVPDVKSLTIFKDSEVEARDYFLKAIPQMLLCIIIGIFIYNGYYRDVAVSVGRFGSEAFTRVMVSADPVGLVDKIFNTVGMPEFATKDSPLTADKIIYKSSSSMYSAIITKHTDIQTTSQRQTLASEIEEWVTTVVNGSPCNKYTTDEYDATYKYSIKVGLSPAFSDKTDEYEDGAVLVWYKSLDEFTMDSAIDKAGLTHVKLQIVFTKVSSKDNDGSSGGSSSGGSSVPTELRDYTETDALHINVPVAVSANSGVQQVSNNTRVSAPDGYIFYISGTASHSGFAIDKDAKQKGNYYAGIILPSGTAYSSVIPLDTSIWAVDHTNRTRARVTLNLQQQ